MRVLIVGGTRFIGAHIARRFYDDGAEVTVLHRGRSSNPILPPVRHIHDPAAEYPITHFPVSVSGCDWDVVIHAVLMGEADARAAVEAFSGRAGRLVMLSSGDVYRAYGRLTRTEPGTPDPLPLKETAPLRTVLYPYRGQEALIGAYAHDYEKILAERVLTESDGLPWTILRLPKVYGLEDNGDLATIYGFVAQPEWRWTHGHVGNVAAAAVSAAFHPRAENAIFNVGEAQTPTMGERLARLPFREAPITPVPAFDFDQSIVYNTGRIRDELGFVDVIDEEEAMRVLASAAS